MTDYNIRNLFQVTEVDKYHYMNYQVEEQMGYANDFEQLMGYYSYYLDGANAEGFSSALARVYKNMTLEDYLDEVSTYNSKVIESLSSLLTYGLGSLGTEEILQDLENLDDSYKEMEAYKELKEAAEIMW